MSTSPAPTNGQPDEQPRDAAYWSAVITGLTVSNVPSGALNLNVEGKLVNGPLQGFGKMWQKTYRVILSGTSLSAKEIIKTWKEHFSEFWPTGNRFYGPLTGIAPGEVALLNLSLAGGLKLSTGVLVLYADDESFTLMTPQGHVFAGWITFSAFEEDGCMVAQAQVLMRASDPIYEIGFRLGMYKEEDKFWLHTLKSLATSFGVDEPVQMTAICVDPRLQWSQTKNVWHNAAMRTTMYSMSSPLRWIRGRGRKRIQK
ncbi:MAG TPA: hypothetical protein VJO32_03375 [Ktedonobacteraceae bacterium]|nr:hypothetical protein [Ktedonobacteraceae bacterium]